MPRATRSVKRRCAAVVSVLAIASATAGCGGEPVSTVEPATAPNSSAVSPSSTTAGPLSTTRLTTTSTMKVPADPLVIAEGWLAAYELGDVVAFQALMHPDATARCVGCAYDRSEEPYFAQLGEGTSDISDSRLLALANGAIERSCDADEGTVRCETLRSSDFGYRDAAGAVRLQFDATYEFTIEDGLITRRILILHSGHTFDFGVVADYERWLRANHPDVHEQIFAFGTILLATAEQYELHQQYVPSYLAAR